MGESLRKHLDSDIAFEVGTLPQWKQLSRGGGSNTTTTASGSILSVFVGGFLGLNIICRFVSSVWMIIPWFGRSSSTIRTRARHRSAPHGGGRANRGALRATPARCYGDGLEAAGNVQSGRGSTDLFFSFQPSLHSLRSVSIQKAQTGKAVNWQQLTLSELRWARN